MMNDQKADMNETAVTKIHSRRLVTARIIDRIERVEGVNFLHIDGWTVIQPSNGHFEEGQLVIYCEIDSFVPVSDRFWKYQHHFWDIKNVMFQGISGFRVGTRLIGKNLSQGLAFHMNEFLEVKEELDNLSKTYGREQAINKLMAMSFEGILGIKKWVCPMTDAHDAKMGQAPGYIARPVWERAQNIRDLFSDRRMNTVYQISEKLDGRCMSVYFVDHGPKWCKSLPELPEGSGSAMSAKDGRVGVCTRTYDWLDNGRNIFWEAAKQLKLHEKIQRIGRNIAIQGEFCRSTIEINSMVLAEGEHIFMVFAIWDIARMRYMDASQVEHICKKYGIQHTPVIGYQKLGDFANNLDDLIAKADGVGLNGEIREGLVFKSLDGLDTFKVISNAWLLETGE
jgi:RNA ligase (TIGR02306 family)